MREKIDTIPINDAFDSGDECPFCYLERQAEQEASEKHQREVESALQRSQARVAQAKADAEQEAQPLFASSRQTQDALKNTPSARVDKAAKQIVERIVGNGN